MIASPTLNERKAGALLLASELLDRPSGGTATADPGDPCLHTKQVSAALQDSQYKRRKNYGLRDAAQKIMLAPELARLRACGCRVANEDSLGIVVGETAYFSGVQLCGSVWGCPVCAAKIRYRRGLEISAAMLGCLKAGGGLEFLTLTIPHNRSDSMVETFDAVAKGFSHLLKGRRWVRVRAKFGVHGTIRTLEGTHGGNGWHNHLHGIFFTDKPLTDEQRTALNLHLFTLWADFIEKRGFRRPLLERCRLEPVRSAEKVAEYVAKAVAFELTRQDLKPAGGSSRTSWQILADWAEYGADRDRLLFLDWVMGTKGRQAITWSKGLKARYGVGEVPDEALNEGTESGEDRPTEFIPVSVREFRAAVRAGARSLLLDVAETEGVAGVRRLLDELVAADVVSSLVWSERGRVWRN